ncbi:high affinity immunoglobulin gamma Fc receptor I-like isoform X2 [Mugil cephalus]|uniref:high affinity immunoglobulin gamma Fc receptor I-like isoform X2 n=1 Tax=Mugil cephalus TaxID=48193 RepID=UPI001FB64875|nr:high affinity immunoglobulin gamma Fc receptor I-like isoform X2 [Mugil cephalus]
MNPPEFLFLTIRTFTMDTVTSLLVISTLLQLVAPEAHSETELKPTVEIVTGASRIFSGETVRLRCDIHDEHGSVWNHQWFRESEMLPQTERVLILWNIKMKDGGNYYCKGVRKTKVGDRYTLQSLPVEINVDGGWAILQAPTHPSLVGDTLSLLCRLREKFPIQETILYKDGVEVMRQIGPNLNLTLSNVSLEDKGMYSCRASWDIQRRTVSVVSVATYVEVLEVLTKPVLEITTDPRLREINKMKLTCHVQYNARAPAPPISFYFYKNGIRLGTATSENHDLVRLSPGQFSCRAKVLASGLSKLSEPKIYGQTTGAHMAHPRGPVLSSPRLHRASAMQPSMTQHITLSLDSVQHAEKPSQPVQGTPSATVHTMTVATPPASDHITSHESTHTDTDSDDNDEFQDESVQFLTPAAGKATEDNSDLH